MQNLQYSTGNSKLCGDLNGKKILKRGNICVHIGFIYGSDSKESACNAGDPDLILGGEDPLEKGTATHSSVLAWRMLDIATEDGQRSLAKSRTRRSA